MAQVLGDGGLVAGEDHLVLQGRWAMGCEQRRVVDVEEALLHEQHPAATTGQHIGGFGTFHAGVDRYQYRAGAVDAQRGKDPLAAVGRPQADPVARLDAQRH